jgi:microcin C transport system substrate-binding protein
VADELIAQVVAARDLETLKATTRALDRVVLWNYNVVPMYYRDEAWLAYWNKFGRPDQRPRYGHGFPSSWWWDEDRAEKIAKK